MNYLAAELSRFQKKLYFYGCKQGSIKLIYPDTLPTYGTGQVSLSGFVQLTNFNSLRF